MKNVYGNLYFAVEAIEDVPTEIKEIYLRGIDLIDFDYDHNLVKVEKDRQSITILNYPHLHTHAHPYLKASMKIFLDSKNNFKKKVESKDNPVILHRIELMLSNKNKRIEKLKELTRIEEENGLYSEEHIKFIGRRKYWNSICRTLNLKNSISPEDNLIATQLDLFGNSSTSIKRGKTAMSTKRPSSPTKKMLEKKLVRNKVFDWGCGKGRDTNFLKEQGFEVISYDKYNKPYPTPADTDFSEINTILLNYVLNVIEDKHERLELLKEIQTSGKEGCALLISVRSSKEIEEFAKKSKWKHFNDGYITSRNTFQKGFTKNELSELLQEIMTIDIIEDCNSYIYSIGNLKKS